MTEYIEPEQALAVVAQSQIGLEELAETLGSHLAPIANS